MKEELKSAIDAIFKRCEEIVESSLDPQRDPGEYFTAKEIKTNIDLCVGFARAYANLKKAEDAIKQEESLARLKEKVVMADYVLAERMTCNPHTINCIIRCEEFVLDLMMEGNPILLSVAKFIVKVPLILPHILRAAFTDIQHQLATSAKVNGDAIPVRIVQDQYEGLANGKKKRGRHPNFTPEQLTACSTLWVAGLKNATIKAMTNTRTKRESVFKFYHKQLEAVGIVTLDDFNSALKSCANRSAYKSVTSN